MKTVLSIALSVLLVVIMSPNAFSALTSYNFTGELSVDYVGTSAAPFLNALNNSFLGPVNGLLTYDSEGHIFSDDINQFQPPGIFVKVGERWSVPGSIFIEFANGTTIESNGLLVDVISTDVWFPFHELHVIANTPLPPNFWTVTPPDPFLPGPYAGISFIMEFNYNLITLEPPPPALPMNDFLQARGYQRFLSDFDGDHLGEFPSEIMEIVLRVTDFHPVPIPTSILLLGSGLIGLAGFRRKFKKS